MMDYADGPSIISDHPEPETKTEVNFRLTKEFRDKLRIFTFTTFVILIVFSSASALTCIIIWHQWPKLDRLTNMYQAFFGFVCASVLNIIGCSAGLATFSENDGQKMDQLHSTAVCMLLIGSIVYNIVLPTSGLMPLEIDSRKRIVEVPVLDCADLKHDSKLKGIAVPECDHAEGAALCLCLMYFLVFLELIALCSYGYMKRQQYKDLNLKEHDDSTLHSSLMLKDTDTIMTEQSIFVGSLPTCTTTDVVTIIPQDQFVTRRMSDRARARDQFYWERDQMVKPDGTVIRSQSAVMKSQSPVRISNSRSRN